MRLLPRWLLAWILLLSASAFGQAAPDLAASDQLIVDEFACRGNVATSCDFILGHIYLAPGDTLDEEELANARLRLSSLPSFRSVDIYLEKGSARGHVRVVIEVAEADPYIREWLAGTSLRFDRPTQLLTGRLTHQNLFGTGKLLDLTMLALVPFDGQPRDEYSARVQYIDPHWLGSKRTFLIGGVSGGYSDHQDRNEVRTRIDNIGFDVTVGRRIFDFSYLSVFYRHNTLAHVEQVLPTLDGGVERRSDSFTNHVLVANYGWNSEDHPYFPTRGSRASLSWSWISTLEGETLLDGGFRKTWTTDGGTSWLVQVSEAPGTEYRSQITEQFAWTVGVARPIAGSADGEVRRGRWYVEAGYEMGHNVGGEHEREYGLKLGVRLETRSFGMVELYVIGSGIDKRRSGQ